MPKHKQIYNYWTAPYQGFAYGTLDPGVHNYYEAEATLDTSANNI